MAGVGGEALAAGGDPAAAAGAARATRRGPPSTARRPGWPGFRVSANAGLGAGTSGEFYREPRIHEYADRVGIRLNDLSLR